MPVERLRDALRLDSGERFYFLYGPGVLDTYLTGDYTESSLEAALHRRLREHGFGRVAFYRPHQDVYFLDEASRAAALGGHGRGLAGPTRMARLGRGPLGDLMLRPPQQPPGPHTGAPMGDVHALTLLDALLRDSRGPRTAVVLLQAATMFREFEDRRTLAGRIGSWFGGLPTGNRNIVIFAFAAMEYADLRETVRESSIPELQTYVCYREPGGGPTCALVYLGAPDQRELSRALHYARLKHGVSLTWKDAAPLIQWLAAEGGSLQDWLQRFIEAGQFDRNIALERKWLRAAIPGSTAWDRLNSLVGLDGVKQRLRLLADFAGEEARLRVAGTVGAGEPLSLHMVFSGNPGTGKTTVAGLVGEIYRDLGLLRRGHVETCQPSDLIGNVVGDTALKTNARVDRALDGVLFVDEAYQLVEKDRGGFGAEAVDTLLLRMENDRHRLAVIVAGYSEKMSAFLRANPGLTSRFPSENVVEFADYSPAELFSILMRMIRQRQLECADEAGAALREIVDRLDAAPDLGSGNARAMRSLADALRMRRHARVRAGALAASEPIRASDIPESYRSVLRGPGALTTTELLAGFDRLVGLESVKEFLRVRASALRLEALQRRRQVNSNPQPLHMIFAGNPGTGKTTVARMLGEILRNMGLLRKGHVVEVRREQLVAPFVGQTAPLVAVAVEKALDGILFIDEAYSLVRDIERGFGQEAIDALNGAMENYPGRLVVIAAGYTDEMAQFVGANPGLASRFVHSIEFPDYSVPQLLAMLHTMAAAERIEIVSEAWERAAAWIEEQRSGKAGRNFGNARTVRNLFSEMKGRLAQRHADTPDDLVEFRFLPEDVPDPVRPNLGASGSSRHADLISSLPPTPQPLSLEQTRVAVGYVSVRQADGRTGSGSGFLVNPLGTLITCYHVVEGAADIRVRLECAPTVEIPAELMAWDGKADLAVLRLPPANYPWLPLAEPDYVPPLGESVAVFGYPLGQELGREVTYTRGEVGSVRTTESGTMIQVSASVTRGNSGGPLLRISDLRVIGIIEGGVRQEIASGLNFAISVSEVFRKFGARNSSGRTGASCRSVDMV